MRIKKYYTKIFEYDLRYLLEKGINEWCASNQGKIHIVNISYSAMKYSYSVIIVYTKLEED